MPKKSTRKRTTRKSTTKKSTAKEQETKPLKDSEETLDTTTQGLSSKEQPEVVQGSIQKENVEPDVKEVIPAPEKKKPKTIYLFPQPVVTVSEGKVTHLKKE